MRVDGIDPNPQGADAEVVVGLHGPAVDHFQ